MKARSESVIWSPGVPHDPARWPFFYGWTVLVVGTLGSLASIPGQTMGVSVFTDFLIEALGVSRVQLSTAYMIGTIISGLFLPWAGRLYDRLGARRMAFYASVLLGVNLAFLSQCDRISDVLSAAIPAGVVVPITVVLAGFLGVRFLGQGVLTMISRSMMSKWFQRRRGTAMAASGVVITFGFSLAPKLLDMMIGRSGWRGTWLILGGAIGIGMALVGWLFYRENPEESGLRMDGQAPVVDAAGAEIPDESSAVRREFTSAEACRTRTFWAFNLAIALNAMVATAFTFHIVSIGEEMGLVRAQAFNLFLPMALVGVVSHFGSGWLSDRIELKYLLYALLGGTALGLGGILRMPAPGGLAVMIAGFGVANGLWGTLVAVTWPRFYGRTHLGAISGVNMSTMVIASAMGPYLFSLSNQYAGSYRPVIGLCLLLPLMLAFVAMGTVDPQRDRV